MDHRPTGGRARREPRLIPVLAVGQQVPVPDRLRRQQGERTGGDGHRRATDGGRHVSVRPALGDVVRHQRRRERDRHDGDQQQVGARRAARRPEARVLISDPRGGGRPQASRPPLLGATRWLGCARPRRMRRGSSLPDPAGSNCTRRPDRRPIRWGSCGACGGSGRVGARRGPWRDAMTYSRDDTPLRGAEKCRAPPAAGAARRVVGCVRKTRRLRGRQVSGRGVPGGDEGVPSPW